MSNISSLFESNDSYVAYRCSKYCVNEIKGCGFSLSYLLTNKKELINSDIRLWKCLEKGTSIARIWNNDKLRITIPNGNYSGDIVFSLRSVISSFLSSGERIVEITQVPKSTFGMAFDLVVGSHV